MSCQKSRLVFLVTLQNHLKEVLNLAMQELFTMTILVWLSELTCIMYTIYMYIYHSVFFSMHTLYFLHAWHCCNELVYICIVYV